MSVRLVCYYCPTPPVFRDSSGRLLCSGCNAVEGGGAVQQRHASPQQKLVVRGVVPRSDYFARSIEETRRAVDDLAFVFRAGGDDKRVHG